MKAFLYLFLILLPSLAYGQADNGTVNGTIFPGIDVKKNLVQNPKAEKNAIGVTAYADAAGTIPVDGTGGSPTVTCTRTTSSPIEDVGSFLLTKDAANRQGEGCAWTLNSLKKAKVYKIEFEYIVNSGTFVSATSSANSDVTFYIYDITNAVLIQPSSIKLFSNNSTLTDKYSAYFQTSSSSASYRLIAHVGTTSASAYTLKIDNVAVSESVYVYGTPVTDWVAYTPTITGFGTATSVSFFSRRVGDSLEVKGKFTAGTVAGSTATVTVGYAGTSANVSIDSAKLGSGNIVGQAFTDAAASTTFFGRISIIGTSGTTVGMGVRTSTTVDSSSLNGNVITGTGGFVSMYFSVPISGWSASIQMTDGFDTRFIGMTAPDQTPTGTIANAANIVKFGTLSQDTTASYSTSTGLYTVPSTGYYFVHAQLDIAHVSVTAAQVAIVYLQNSGTTFAKGADFARVTSVTELVPQASGIIYAVAGTTIGAYSLSNANTPTYTNNVGGSHLYIIKMQAPSAIGVNEIVAMKATSSVTSLTNGSTIDIVNPTVAKDTHGGYNASTGVYTVPIAGTYKVHGSYHNAGTFTSPSIGRQWSIFINKTGTNIAASGNLVQTTSTLSDNFFAEVDTEVDCVAGDTLKLQGNQNVNASTAMVLDGSAAYNYFTVSRIK